MFVNYRQHLERLTLLEEAPGAAKTTDTTDVTEVATTEQPHPAVSPTRVQAAPKGERAVPRTAPRFVPAPPPVEPPPAATPLAKADLLEKAGEKDGDTTYTRLVEQALDVVPRLTDSERGTLRAVAYKRQARLKLALHQHPSTAGAPASLEDDDLSTVEQQVLGPERYREYRSALRDLLDD